MPLVTDVHTTRQLLDTFRAREVALPCFCTENAWTTEAILEATVAAGERFGIECPPVSISFCGSYHARRHLSNYWYCGNQKLGFRGVMGDLRTLLSPEGPYAGCRVFPMLDHGQPEGDEWLLQERPDDFAMVMFDASHWPLEENIRRTARYVEQHGDRVVVEGAVAELKEAREEGEAFAMTTPEQAERFLRETGCDLIVPNVGTEHRAAEAGQAEYCAERAREIAAVVESSLVLHGTSCMGRADLSSVPHDGFVKVNVWTIIEKTGAQKIVEFVLSNVGNLIEREKLVELVEQGLLGELMVKPEYVDEAFGGHVGPDLDYFPVTNLHDGWVEAVSEVLQRYFEMFGYERLSG